MESESNHIECVGADGTSRTFSVEMEREDPRGEVTIYVRTVPPPESGEFFQLSLKHESEGIARITMINHHRCSEYSAKGIPESLLLHAMGQLAVTIESSPTSGDGNVFRSDQAEKMWRRLEGKGLAVYIEERDVFRCNS